MDIDEAHFTLKSIESAYGRAAKPMRVRDVGHYRRGAKALNLLIAVEPGNPNIPLNMNGSVRYPRRWFRITKDNVDQVVFARFIDQICRSIEANPVDGDEEKIFMWDNLSAHLTPVVTNTLELRPTREQYQFSSLPRPPYQAKWAPVEYVICQIANILSNKVVANWTEQTLSMELHNACMTVGYEGKFDNTFAHCGY